jgi:hypothetical protein
MVWEVQQAAANALLEISRMDKAVTALLDLITNLKTEPTTRQAALRWLPQRLGNPSIVGNRLRDLQSNLKELENETGLQDMSTEGDRNSHGVKQPITAARSIIYVLARIHTESDDIIFADTPYTIQAGISHRQLQGFITATAEVDAHAPGAALSIDILVHSPDEHVEITSDWRQIVEYTIGQDDPQMVDFTFLVTQPEPIEISVDFYHAAGWPRTIKFTFDNVQSTASRSVPSVTASSTQAEGEM